LKSPSSYASDACGETSIGEQDLVNVEPLGVRLSPNVASLYGVYMVPVHPFLEMWLRIVAWGPLSGVGIKVSLLFEDGIATTAIVLWLAVYSIKVLL
jgi:hypothetical protein